MLETAESKCSLLFWVVSWVHEATKASRSPMTAACFLATVFNKRCGKEAAPRSTCRRKTTLVTSCPDDVTGCRIQQLGIISPLTASTLDLGNDSSSTDCMAKTCNPPCLAAVLMQQKSRGWLRWHLDGSVSMYTSWVLSSSGRVHTERTAWLNKWLLDTWEITDHRLSRGLCKSAAPKKLCTGDTEEGL